MTLTDIKIRKATAKSKEYKLFDGSGLYILIYPSGTKVWRFKYQFAGKEKLISFDKYPEVSLGDARERRFEAKKLIVNGIDPSNKKREDKQQAIYQACNTFQSLAKQWHENTKYKWVPGYAEDILTRMSNHLFPVIGHRPIDSIKPLEILALLKKIEANGHYETVHKLLGYTQNVFRYAVVAGLIDSNPARELGIAIKPNHKKHYPSIKAAELPEFLKALELANTSIQNKIALKLLLLTFMRTGELRKSKWAYIDFKARQWHVPAEIMKMKRPHIVPLSAQAIDLLNKLKPITGHSEYIFPSNHKRKCPHINENTINHVIKKQMKYAGKMVGHGVRSLASTVLNEQGFNSDAIERQLAHKERDNIRAAYNFAEYMPERIQMMDWWGNFVMGNMPL